MHLTLPSYLEDVQCRDYHKLENLNSTWMCNFVNTTDDCQIDDGFVNYLVLTYCGFNLETTWLAIILLAFWLFVLFVGLGVTADTFYGVTFLAFGNGAPDVFSAIAAIGNAKGGDAGLAFGALFGAGVFVSTVIVGIICFISPFNSVQRPLLRDLIFFLVAGFWAFVVVWDGKIVLWETLGFLLMYVVYILVVVLGRYVNQRIKFRMGGEAALRKNDFSSEISRRKSLNHGDIAHPVNVDEYTAEEEYESENLTRPLLTKTNVEELPDVGFCKKDVFKNTFIPIDLDDWRSSNILFKLMILVKAPVILILKLTVPLVDYDVANHNWNKLTIMINCILAPFFIVIATKMFFYNLFGLIPMWVVAIVVGVGSSLIIYFTTSMTQKPRLHWIFAYVGFFVSVVWIYTIANEIVNLLTAFGVILNISNTILGLTFLAWGNSLSDLVADVFSAKRGFPNMGISACFGGPLFNILLGVGIPFTLKCFNSPEGFLIKKSFLQDTLAFFLGVSLCSTLIFIPLNKFHFNKKYGMYLLFVYVTFLTTCILIESGVIQSPY